MKKLLLALGLVLGTFPVHAQGTIPVAMNVQQDANGQPLAGALLYTYVVGTVSTPEIAYQDPGLTLTLPWPVVADGNGRLPMFYLPAGSVHARLTDASGNVQFDYPAVLVIGGTTSGGGGGGGPSVDPTSIASTGDIKFRLTSETLAGWVILNGETIGSATSGGTSLASSSAQNLYVYLWTNCPNTHCPVSTGRGASALADFAANKTLQLMDMRDSLLVGRDCMGSSCLGGLLLSNITSGGTDTADTPGAFGGVANQIIAQTNIPSYNLIIPAGQGSHSHTIPGVFTSPNISFGGSSPFLLTGSGVVTGTSTLPQMSAQSGGSGVALPVMNPFKLGTFYCKL